MDKKTEYSNIPPSIESKLGRNLHNEKNHPVETMKNFIFSYFDSLENYKFDKFDNLSPFVSVEDNFDKLLLPENHPARSKSDTYYVNEKTVLRTHTTAHQNELLEKGYTNFLVAGDVYRKDEIDRHHYPVFHQLEGVAKVSEGDDPKKVLLDILGGLAKHLFPGCEYRINDDYFPFTDPSYEIEVLHNGEWIEILGCGIMHKDIVKNNNLDGDYIAFGLGIERLVLIAFEIPDIRYLWSTHERFYEQFKEGKIIKFKPYSELPSIDKDISFWIPDDKIKQLEDFSGNKEEKWIDDNDFCELAREICGDWVEEIKLMDKFYHPKKKKHSRMYRIRFSPNDPELKDPGDFNRLINKIQDGFREEVDKKIDVELR